MADETKKLFKILRKTEKQFEAAVGKPIKMARIAKKASATAKKIKRMYPDWDGDGWL